MFQKHIILFEPLLDEKDKEKYKIINNISIKISVKYISYSMENIFINTNEYVINVHVYLYKNKEKTLN